MDGDDLATPAREVDLTVLPFRGAAEELVFAHLVAQRTNAGLDGDVELPDRPAFVRLDGSSAVAGCSMRRNSSRASAPNGAGTTETTRHPLHDGIVFRTDRALQTPSKGWNW